VALRVALEWAVETIEEVTVAITGIEPRLILGIDRANVNTGEIQAVLIAFRDLVCPKYVVGFDVSGDECVPIGCELASLLQGAADQLGLGVPIHAGEAGPPENIWFAITECGATRIGSPPLQRVTASM
jgi:adenosine deaminase